MAKRTIHRRTLLRGCGAAVALPWLEAMRRPARAAVETSAPQRLAFFYIPNGVVQSAWHPTTNESGLVLSPTLEPLQHVKHKISVISGLDRVKVPGTDGHAQASTCWLSSAAPDELSPAGYPLKRTVDQIVADHTGQRTAFRSLELSCNSYEDNKESIYFDNISWYGHGHVARSLRDPNRVFQRLFAMDEQQSYRSILDVVREDARALSTQLGITDRRKLDEYMDSVRSVERQIDRIRARQESIDGLQLQPPSQRWQNMRRDEHIQIMGDLMILALQTDLTRVATLMVSPERWSTPQMVHGLFDKPVMHHSMTHAQGDPQVRDKLQKLDHYHIDQFAQMVTKMDAIQEGEGTLLDHSLFVLGSGLSSGKTHIYSDLPTVIAGAGGRELPTNRYIQQPAGTPVANLWLSLARTMGVSMPRLGDSTEALRLA